MQDHRDGPEQQEAQDDGEGIDMVTMDASGDKALMKTSVARGAKRPRPISRAGVVEAAFAPFTARHGRERAILGLIEEIVARERHDMAVGAQNMALSAREASLFRCIRIERTWHTRTSTIRMESGRTALHAAIELIAAGEGLDVDGKVDGMCIRGTHRRQQQMYFDAAILIHNRGLGVLGLLNGIANEECDRMKDAIGICLSKIIDALTTYYEGHLLNLAQMEHGRIKEYRGAEGSRKCVERIM